MAARIVAGIQAEGLLEPTVLATLSLVQLKLAAELAGKDDSEDVIEEATELLKAKWAAAQLAGKAAINAAAVEWRLSKYKHNHIENKAPKPNLHESQAAFSSHKVAKVQADSWASGSGTRTLAEVRCNAEDIERTKLAEKALAWMIQADLVEEDDENTDQWRAAMITRLKKGLRARTLRLRVQAAIKAIKWTQAARAGEWFSTVSDLEAYMVDLGSMKGAGISTFERARYGVMYLEAAAGTAIPEMLSLSPALKSTIQELMLEKSSGGLRVKKQAPQLLVHTLKRWEQLVVSEAPKFHRAYAWLKLVSFWSALRGDDATWLAASSVSITMEHGLQCVLRRTKTTGPGKKSPSRPVIVSNEAYFEEESWLQVGWDLWSGQNPDRENFLLLPTADGSGFREFGAEPADRAALNRALIAQYGLWEVESDDSPFPKLCQIAAAYWTEHSTRASIVTMARGIGVEKTVTDRIGHWVAQSTSADEYIRCGRALVSDAQRKVAKVVRAEESRVLAGDPFGENWVLTDLRDFLTKAHPTLGPEEINEYVSHLKFFGSQNVSRSVRESFVLRDKIEVQLNSESSEEETPPLTSTIPGIGTWVVTVGRGASTLHIVGKCYRKPQKHYSAWVAVTDPVNSASYKKPCKTCFPRGYPLITGAPKEALGECLEAGMPEALATEEASASSDSDSD